MSGEGKVEEKALFEQPPILAEVAVHPASAELMIALNDQIKADDQAEFCLACAQAFIGYATTAMKRPKSRIIRPRVMLP